jgi:hypothetical protein
MVEIIISLFINYNVEGSEVVDHYLGTINFLLMLFKFSFLFEFSHVKSWLRNGSIHYFSLSVMNQGPKGKVISLVHCNIFP